jgi:chorismate dehydratase
MQIRTQSVATPKMEILTHASNHLESAITKIGAVSYLNTKPLIFGLQRRLEGVGSLSVDLPSQLAAQLSDSQIDVGLIPVVEYFKNDTYRIVSNAAIACRGPVWSVRLFFRCEPSKARTIAMDIGSRTSAALTKVLFHGQFGFVPDAIPLELADDPREAKADAVLVIGDRAMHPEALRNDFLSEWDLGQVWLEQTGLPFVFAMWVARSEQFANATLSKAFEESREDGIMHLDDFRLGPDELLGLAEFRTRCERLHLI